MNTRKLLSFIFMLGCFINSVGYSIPNFPVPHTAPSKSRPTPVQNATLAEKKFVEENESKRNEVVESEKPIQNHGSK